MLEYGDIFDFQLSAMSFEYLTAGFIVAYGVIVAWMATRPENRALGSLQTR
jgi:hypothetical protein